MTYNDRGLREISAGLRDAKALITRKRTDAQHQMGVLEAEISAQGKIEAALDAALEVLRAEQMKREDERTRANAE